MNLGGALSVTLRDYQLDLVDRGRAAMKRCRRVLLQLPTGGGKTAIASYLAEASSSRGLLVWFVCHRKELVAQTSNTFTRFGIPHGLIAAGRPLDLRWPVQVCSIDTLRGRLPLLQAADLVIWDECHHMAAGTWAAVMGALPPRTRHVGLSATPMRTDGQGLGAYFDELVLGPEVAWLIEQGYLSPYQLFAPPPPPELKATGTRDGTQKQARVMMKPKVTGDIVGHWMRHSEGLRTVAFACNVEHSEHIAERFRSNGIPAAHIDGETRTGDRDRIIRDYAEGRLAVLSNVALFGEGFDLAAIAQRDVTIDSVILARQTSSLPLYRQQVGRALRPQPGKVAVILDHAGNFRQHGFPDDEFEWTLEGREKGASALSIVSKPIDCPGCFRQLRRPCPDVCPSCNTTLRKPVEIVTAEGELECQNTPEQRRADRQRREREEELACRDGLGALIVLASRRGKADPQRWAMRRLAQYAESTRKAA